MPRPTPAPRTEAAEQFQRWWITHGRARFGTAKRLAAEAGVGPATLSQYFSGEHFPSPEPRAKLYEITQAPAFKIFVAQRQHPWKGTSLDSTRAPFADDLNAWFQGQRRFTTKRAMAQALRLRPSKLQNYFSSRRYPEPEQREKLYQLTGLSCFGLAWPSACHLHRTLRRVKEPWLREVILKMHEHIDSHHSTQGGRTPLYYYETQFVENVRRHGIEDLAHLDPLRLAAFSFHRLRNRRKVSAALRDKRRLLALAFFSRFLVFAGYWTQEQKAKLFDLLLEMRPKQQVKKERRPGQYNTPPELVSLVKALILDCGVYPKEARTLRRAQIEPAVGVRLASGVLLPFGQGWHHLPENALGDWIKHAKLQDFLFYQKRPTDYGRPAHSDLLLAAARRIGPKLTLSSLREAHFRGDFQREPNRKLFGLHLAKYHNLQAAYTLKLWKKFAYQAKSFRLPRPFLTALQVACRIVPGKPRRLEGGRRSELRHADGDYEVSVTWPSGFAVKLEKSGVDALRFLYKKARDLWLGRDGLKGTTAKLVGGLSRTMVQVRDIQRGSVWAGVLFQTRSRKRHFEMPILEQMRGGVVSPQCAICQHPDREAVDAECRPLLQRSNRIKGLAQVARRHNVSYTSLQVHCGLRRTSAQRSHVATAPAAPTTGCPVSLSQDMGKAEILQFIQGN